ncbi:MAG TPA: PilZ domain-containing protein [Candidatus Limnocylindrales bacterium]
MMDTPRQPEVHDQVLVETEIDGRVVAFRAIVVNVMPAALWLGLTTPDARLEKVKPGEVMVLTFRHDDVGMVAESAFVSHLGSGAVRMFSIEMPTDLRLIQRRFHLRLDTVCPIEYTVVSQDQTSGAGATGEGMTRNISAGGVQFLLKAPISETMDVGAELELAMLLGQDVVLAEGRALRVEDATDIGPDGRRLGQTATPRQPRTWVAVQFESISEEGQDRIVRHIFSLQRMRREAPKRGA